MPKKYNLLKIQIKEEDKDTQVHTNTNGTTLDKKIVRISTLKGLISTSEHYFIY